MLLGGRDITHQSPAKRGTAMMFQCHALFPHLSVTDNLAFSARIKGAVRADCEARAMDLLKLVPMKPLAQRLPAAKLPLGLLIMFAVFNRFNPAYEEAARDLGATPWQSLRHVVLPLIGPSLVGVGMFGFTLSWDEIACSSQAMGDLNTLPLELQGLTTTVTTPVIYALGTVTTVVSFAVMGITLGAVALLSGLQKRRAHA